jgi:hypothetical protein
MLGIVKKRGEVKGRRDSEGHWFVLRVRRVIVGCRASIDFLRLFLGDKNEHADYVRFHLGDMVKMNMLIMSVFT